MVVIMPSKIYRTPPEPRSHLHFIDRIDLTIGGFGPTHEPRGERIERLRELWYVFGKQLMAEFPMECWGFQKFGEP